MNFRPALVFTLQLALAAILPGNTEGGRPAGNYIKQQSISVEDMILASTPILGPGGNVVGMTLPLKRAGRLFLLEGTIDHVTGNFILDTGASGLVLNKTYFRNAIAVDDEDGGGVTGTTGQVTRISVKLLQVGEMTYQNISADVTPLGHLENRRGVKILGLFGMTMLKNLQLVIDIRNNELQLFKLDRNGNTIDPGFQKVKFDVVQKVEEYRNIMFVKATMGGKILDFCLDTGAESNVVSVDAPKKALNSITITRRSNLNGVGSKQGEVLYGTLNDFSFGNIQMTPMETILCSLADMAHQYAYPIDGMLGYDFFSKGKIYINLVKKEMGICLKTEGKP
ncbi:MAG: pepsin/retropepsin-like aspartic protease family protein [Bacteroidota bacterium]